MNNSLIVGLSSWIIQDGNYGEFKRGDQPAFALEFSAPSALSVIEGGGQTASLDHLHGGTYRIAGKVVHVLDIEWWAIDVGVLMYQEGRPPSDAEEGSWITGEAIEATNARKDGVADYLLHRERLDNPPRR
jgi:hypothetical protein